MFTKNLVGGLDSADLTAGGAGGGGYGKKEVVVFLRGGGGGGERGGGWLCWGGGGGVDTPLHTVVGKFERTWIYNVVL